MRDPSLVGSAGQMLCQFIFSSSLSSFSPIALPTLLTLARPETFRQGHCTPDERDAILHSASLLTAELAPICPHAFSAGSAASLLAAFARAHRFDQELFAAVGGVIEFLEGSGRGKMTLSEAAACLVAMAQAVEGGHATPASLPLASMGRIASNSLRDSTQGHSGFNARAAAEVASSAARLRLRCCPLLASLSRVVTDGGAGGVLSTDIMFSLASLGWRDDAAVEAWGEALEVASVGGDDEGGVSLGKVCWAAAALRGCGEGVHAWVRRAVDEAEARSLQGYEISAEDAVRVHQYMIEYDIGILGGGDGEWEEGVGWEGKRGLTQGGARSVTQAQVRNECGT